MKKREQRQAIETLRVDMLAPKEHVYDEYYDRKQDTELCNDQP